MRVRSTGTLSGVFMITPTDPTQETLTVLFLDHTAKLGGGEIALLHLLQHIDRRRFHPVAVLGEEGPLVERLGESGIETHVLPLPTDVANTRKGSLGGNSLLRFRAIGKPSLTAGGLRDSSNPAVSISFTPTH